MSTSLKGKVVFLTGATSGIGEACARQLAQKGARLILCGRREERMRQLCRELEAQGADVLAMQADVRQADQLKHVAKAGLHRFGRIDILVNCAGVMLLSAVRERKIEEWETMIDTNIKGVLHAVAAVLPIMREQRAGLIMNVISTAAYRVMEHSATKAAVRAFSEGLRKEETNHGIRVCLIDPGPVKTELLSHVSDDDIRASLDRYVQQHGMRAETVAEAMIFQMRVEKEASVDERILSPSIKGL